MIRICIKPSRHCADPGLPVTAALFSTYSLCSLIPLSLHPFLFGRPPGSSGKPFPLCSPCPSVRNITRPSSRSSLRSSPCPSACNITRPSPRNSTRSSPCPGTCNSARPSSRNSRRSGPCPSTCNSARPSSRNSRRSGPCPSTRHSARSFPRNSGRSTPRYIIRNSSRSCSCNSTLAGRGSKNPPARQEALIASPRLRVSSPSEP